MRATPGDRIILAGELVDQPTRSGEVLEARGADGGPPYVVRWDDGHESIYEGPYLRKHCPCAECRTRREREAAAGARLDQLADLVPVPCPRLEQGQHQHLGAAFFQLRTEDSHTPPYM